MGPARGDVVYGLSLECFQWKSSGAAARCVYLPHLPDFALHLRNLVAQVLLDVVDLVRQHLDRRLGLPPGRDKQR